MAEIIEVANVAYEARDKAQSEIQSLKLAAEKEQQVRLALLARDAAAPVLRAPRPVPPRRARPAAAPAPACDAPPRLPLHAMRRRACPRCRRRASRRRRPPPPLHTSSDPSRSGG